MGYYLLGTGHAAWLSPASIPAPPELPLLPPRPKPLAPLADADAELVAVHVAGFLRFFASLQPPTAAQEALVVASPSGFRCDSEVVSLSRPRRSLRSDMAWSPPAGTSRDVPGYLFCVEDPFEQIGAGGLNLGRHLTAAKLELINEKTDRALRTLLLHGPDATDDCGLLGRSHDPEPATD